MNIEWISVNKELPGEGLFLCVVKFIDKIDCPLGHINRPNHLIIDLHFDPRIGWDFKYCPPGSQVLYWTDAIKVPDDLD